MPRVPEDVRKVKVESLTLDLSNYRFAADQADETLAFNYLFEEYDVMAIATSLLREGYTTNEVPLVVEEGGHFVVLEANRRICALRALRNPSLVPNYRDKIDALLKRYQTDAEDLPDDIYVTVYPDRQTADHVLARQHIGEDKKRWGLDEQAKFVLAQLTGGMDIKSLRSTLTGIKDVVRLARMGRVREALGEITFTDSSLASYAESAELKMSAFEYAYRDRSIRPLMGFDFDEEGNVVSRPETPGEIAVLERVLRGFKSGELSTRKVLNAKDSEQYKDLLRELRALSGQTFTSPPPTIPDGGPPGGGAIPGPGIPPAGPPPSDTPGRPTPPGGGVPKSPPTTPQGPKHPDTKSKLQVATIQISGLPTGLQKRFIELRRLDINEHPAAAAMLLRSIVESSIKHHYTVRGNRSVSGMLGQVAPQVARDYGKDKGVARSIQLLTNSLAPKDRAGSGSWFNAASHDPVMVIDAQQLRDAWQELEPILHFLLEPPPSPSIP